MFTGGGATCKHLFFVPLLHMPLRGHVYGPVLGAGVLAALTDSYLGIPMGIHTLPQFFETLAPGSTNHAGMLDGHDDLLCLSTKPNAKQPGG